MKIWLPKYRFASQSSLRLDSPVPRHGLAFVSITNESKFRILKPHIPRPSKLRKMACRLKTPPCPALPLYRKEKKWQDASNEVLTRHAVFRYLFALILVLGSFKIAVPQTEPVNVKVRVVIVDKDLNQKPVPFLVVSFHHLANAANSAEVKTDLDGKAEKQLVPGRYSIISAKPVELGGKRYSWNLEIQINAPDQHIDLTNDNAKIEDLAPGSGASAESKPSTSASGGDLSTLFDRLKNSVVTVRSEAGEGSGFLVDSAGLVVTNNHVVQSSNYIAVQFDQRRKVPARLITSNADKDVAVLWFDPAAFREAVVAPLLPDQAPTKIVVGERVFTIGNPLGREKVLTTGVISKVEKDAITSDININPGNSGGPLFTLGGQVAGITTAGLRNLASVVPVENVRPVVETARKQIVGGAPPEPTLLPVEPPDMFPAGVLRALLQQEKMDTKPYFFDAGEFQVAFYTPPVNFFLRHEDEMSAARKAAKRAGGDSSQAKPPASALEDAQDYRPVLVVRVRPKFGQFFKARFKNGFVRMRLLCGGKEMTPIEPGRNEYELLNQRGGTIDTTYQGRYSYLPDAVSPSCGSVTLEIYSEKEPNTPLTRPIDPATVDRVWADFEPYRKAKSTQPTATKP
jgi:S1-C subfamily serine protease